MVVVSVMVELLVIVVETCWPGSGPGHQNLRQPLAGPSESSGQDVGQLGFRQLSKSYTMQAF